MIAQPTSVEPIIQGEFIAAYVTHPQAEIVGTLVRRYSVQIRRFEKCLATEEFKWLDLLVPAYVWSNDQIDTFLRKTVFSGWRVHRKEECSFSNF